MHDNTCHHFSIESKNRSQRQLQLNKLVFLFTKQKVTVLLKNFKYFVWWLMLEGNKTVLRMNKKIVWNALLWFANYFFPHDEASFHLIFQLVGLDFTIWVTQMTQLWVYISWFFRLLLPEGHGDNSQVLPLLQQELHLFLPVDSFLTSWHKACQTCIQKRHALSR